MLGVSRVKAMSSVKFVNVLFNPSMSSLPLFPQADAAGGKVVYPCFI